MFWLTTTLANDVTPGANPNIFQFNTGTVVDATTDNFNFIKVDTAVNTGPGITAQQGFDLAIGLAGVIVVAANSVVAGSYYDATHGQEVVFNVFDGGNGFITAGDTAWVVATIDMTQAEYAVFGNTNLSFTPFV